MLLVILAKWLLLPKISFAIRCLFSAERGVGLGGLERRVERADLCELERRVLPSLRIR
jgi:hypothetical protein